MKAEDIRLINENQGTGRVFFHTYDNKTICRVMTSGEVQKGQLIRKSEGESAFKEYFVGLFNEKYSQPQRTITPSAEDTRLFERGGWNEHLPYLHTPSEVRERGFQADRDYAYSLALAHAP